MKRRRLLLVTAAPAAAAAILGVATAGGSPSSPTYFQDVKPILDGRCAGCHFSGGIAPFPLTSYAQARQKRVAIAQAVASRRMPPWHAVRGVRAYRHDPSLSPAQIAAVRRWASAGGPRGNPAAPGAKLPSLGGGLSRVDRRLELPAYTPRKTAAGDEYRCFVAPGLDKATPYLTGFEIEPGARREVHHVIVYAAAPPDARTVEFWDAQDARPGYPCYGGPSRTGADQIGALFLGGWAPGSTGGDLPAGTGVRVEPGSRLIVQIHYNLESAKPVPDRTSVALRVASSVDRKGLYLPVANPIWVIAPASFSIPAGRRQVVHRFAADPSLFLRYFAPDFDFSKGFVAHSAALHMHRLGKSGELAVERAAGGREPLVRIADWDFNWQRDYRFAKPLTVAPGDRMAIRCEHDNSGRRAGHGAPAKPRLVTWGENSSDEMCIGFVYVTEP
jgi:hypothetical protein